MNRYITPGRAIAFVVGAAIVFTGWGMLFAPGGSGSNVALALVLAVVAVYLVTTNLGAYLDDLFFHGGSRERALLLRRSQQTLHDTRARLKVVLSSKRKKATLNADALQKTENALAKLEETVVNTQNNWSKKDRFAEQIAALASGNEAVAASIKSLFGKAPSQGGIFNGWDSLLMALVAALALRAFIVEPFQIPSGSMIPTMLVGDHLFVSKLRYGIMNPLSRDPSYLVRWSSPKPGDVVVFDAPDYVGTNARETWIKRVIAGPGQTVRLVDTMVYVDGKPYKHLGPGTQVSYLDYYPSGDRSSFFGDSGQGVWREQQAIYNREEIAEGLVHDIYQRVPERRLPFEGNWPMPGQGSMPGLTCSADSCRVNEGHVFVMGDNRGNSSDGRVWGALPIDNVKGKAIFIWMSVDGSRLSVELGRFTLPGFRWERWFKGIH
jgi:signal peptidase I